MFPVTHGLSRFLPSLLLTGMIFTAQSAAGAPESAAAPQEGEKAPNFSLPASDGKTYTLAQFIGVKPTVIAFFPKAFTGG